jgi:hypothetical protein
MTRRVALLLAALAAPACSLDAVGLGPARPLDDAAIDEGADATLDDDADVGDLDSSRAEDGPGDTTDPDSTTLPDAYDASDASDASDTTVGPDALDAADASDADDGVLASDGADTLWGDGDTCIDLVLDGDESDVDCGGHCAKCANGLRCRTGADCGSGSCAPSGLCVSVGCTNGTLDPGEADVDCGGVCDKGCSLGKSCSKGKDCASHFCSSGKCTQPSSCDDIFGSEPTATSGVYALRSTRAGAASPWNAYCAFVGSGVEIGGWTLVLKASKGSATFAYDAALWSDQNLLAGAPDLSGGEAKFEGFLSIPVHALRVGFTSTAASPAKWLVLTLPSTGLPTGLSYPPSSLAAIFATNKYVATAALGRDAWLAALPGSALQKNCNREGLDVAAGLLSVRIGILSNEQGNCDSPDSRLGIGGMGTSCGTDAGNRHGDVCGCGCYDASGGTPTSADLLAQAFVFVR